mmetsp:Transcript_29359/g.77114  ORF Transcript_29359/g.77114 Transcript_29359/m.77114 type:complete len:132 (-) Transcript_29359:391-786(-)
MMSQGKIVELSPGQRTRQFESSAFSSKPLIQKKCKRLWKVYTRQCSVSSVATFSPHLGRFRELLLDVLCWLHCTFNFCEFEITVTLGCAVGDIFRKAAELVARPRLEEALAPDYHKWIDTLIECATPPALA